jgi:hypothetical protein
LGSVRTRWRAADCGNLQRQKPKVPRGNISSFSKPPMIPNVLQQKRVGTP